MLHLNESKQSITRIVEGTVIDHIPAGKAAAIWLLLKLEKHQKTIYVGLNLPSTRMKNKDLIKIADRALSPDEANQIAIFAPDATISIIQDSQIKEKFQVALPEKLEGYIRCPNNRCISNHEGATGSFVLTQLGKNAQLCCRYCRKTFTQNDLTL